jgi:hypothetical protein
VASSVANLIYKPLVLEPGVLILVGSFQHPTSKKATDLLIEFCQLYDFSSSMACGDGSSGLLPEPTTGFLAALGLPFYNKLNLQPRLPVPKLIPRVHTYSAPLDYIQEYMKHVQYFMTLSISPPSVGSVLWSIFFGSQDTVAISSALVWFNT